MKFIKYASIQFGLFLGITGWILMLIFIIKAGLNGNYAVTLEFNLFHEFWFEVVLISVIVGFFIYLIRYFQYEG